MNKATPPPASVLPRTVVVHAPAKVNLSLRVLAREDTGFHRIETLFVALEFGDTVVLSRTVGGVGLTIEGSAPCPVEENLAYRAARAFFEGSGGGGGVEIRLVKRLPQRAGLGGGSSDAAATLRGLQRLFPRRLSADELLELAGALGSDVPFFLSPTSLAWGWGRGDRLLPLSALPQASVLLALPPVEMDTALAYRMIDERRGSAGRGEGSLMVDPGCFSSWNGVAALAHNDFEEVVLPVRPLLASLRRTMQETSCLLTLLAGSGSTVFGVYLDETEALAGKSTLEASFPQTRFILTRTLEYPPDPVLGEGVER